MLQEVKKYIKLRQDFSYRSLMTNNLKFVNLHENLVVIYIL